ncbi:penicillin-binding protein activator [Kiloniella laminariae]|uniref:Penicillin-binding protein activator n=1 Tax=Kiloniella laminariae TaxID=454162 RepID=A0ABT4LJD6_9PROT|nr:penicillin-binding protein activator [Kiloniella laminariae]MCZ4281229.1 penicillin-binding protein activator [Kiloniella laminariae]
MNSTLATFLVGFFARFGRKAVSLPLILATLLTVSACQTTMKTGPDATVEEAPVTESTTSAETEQSEQDAFEALEAEGETEQEPFADLQNQPLIIGDYKTKVGVLLPLSGRHQEVGQALMNAAQLALFDLAGEKFELVVRDTAGTPDGARRAMEGVLQENVDLVIGPLFATSVSAITPLARAAGVSVLSFSNDQAVAGNGVYVLGLTPEEQIRRVIDYAASQGVRRVAVFAPDDDYGRRVVSALQIQSYGSGVELAKLNFFNPNDPDLNDEVKAIASYDQRHQALISHRAQLRAKGDAASLKALRRLNGRDTLNPPGYDAIIVPTGGKQLLTIAPLMNYYDIDPTQVKYIGTALWNNPKLGREPALVGSWYASPSPDHWDGFSSRYHTLYGKEPPRLVTLAYDSVALAAVVARQAESQSIKTNYSQQVLTNPQGFSGLDGVFRLHPDGRSERGLAVLTLKRDLIEVVDPAPASFAPLVN